MGIDRQIDGWVHRGIDRQIADNFTSKALNTESKIEAGPRDTAGSETAVSK